MIGHKLENQVLSLLLPYQPCRIGIFGSYARGENKKGVIWIF